MSADRHFDVVVIGAGHAGCEAALACARLGLKTAVLTLNIDSIALMPCNPSVGGTGKGQLVREVDALGGEMGLAIDDTTLQSRMLNTGKGPAVQSLRAQADKRQYQRRMMHALFSQENLTVLQAEVTDILKGSGGVKGVRTISGQVIGCGAAIVASGVYLNSRVIIGETHWHSGPQGLLSAGRLSASLMDLGFQIRRFKTGTPARIDARSIDFNQMEAQPGDEPVVPFSFLTDRRLENLEQCFLTWTNEQTHEIIRKNLHRSPMFSGAIKGIGARYCPSIEDKVYRFANKDRHQVFLEPEGLSYPEWYAQGLSSSLPEDVQWDMYRSIRGLQHARLTRLAYAIEYDCINPLDLSPSMASHHVQGLYSAGQINGTSGYEEAAAQGILAGINASLYLKGRDPFILTREQAYIGVMADDLSSKGVDEPYRMMTGRVEYRLSLRQDNADLRLTHLSHALGLAGDDRLERTEKKKRETAELIQALRESRGHPGSGPDRTAIDPPGAGYSKEAVSQAEIQMKYEGYLGKESAQIRSAKAMDDWRIPPDIDYMSIASLRIESRQKLTRQKPFSLGQASRIPGVTPADVAVLSVWLKKHRAAAET